MPKQKKSSTREPALSRRERQIMDILYAAGRATGSEIQQRLADQPSYSAVRTILRVLERKGYIRHVEEGLRYVYLPTIAREAARRSALARLLETFFDGSAKEVVAALIDDRSLSLTKDDLEEIGLLLEHAKKEAS